MEITHASQTVPAARGVSTVNYHLIQHCNMRCNFCYARFTDVLKDTGVPARGLDEAKARATVAELCGLGFTKINFAGGETLLRKDLPTLLRIAKTAGLRTSVVTNGKFITADWVDSVNGLLDQVGISVDSAVAETRVLMGRTHMGKDALSNQEYIDRADLIRAAGISLKINTVVTAQNHTEQMGSFIAALRPARWKVFQAMQVDGQNDLEASKILCTDAMYAWFRTRHIGATHGFGTTVFEGNDDMRGSYAMVDPYGRFYDSTASSHTYSAPIWQVGAAKAYAQVRVDTAKFIRRGGEYVIQKPSLLLRHAA